MKKVNLLIALAIIFSAIFVQSCKKDKEQSPDSTESILPKSFKVDVPEAISSANSQKSMLATNGDTLQGNDIYQNLRTFINVGETASDIVNSIMTTISVYNINHAMTLSYQSNEDGRVKNLDVVESASFDGQNWQYQMTIVDANSATNNDGGVALQIFWNVNPVKGIAIIKPYNLNRTESINYPDAIYRIDYSEAGELGYDKHMIVEITGIPLEDPSVDPYSISKLKMFAGKTGDIVDVYGNSVHPNATFIDTTEKGFDWAFVASANQSLDIGVAEVGLPDDDLSSTDRNTLLVTNSIKNVFTNQINIAYPNIDTLSINNYLYNTEAPGYFNSNGFVQGGTAPNTDYTTLANNITNLTPYNPVDIKNLTISFK